jgi:HD-like signal output (HDOD) protein
LERQELKELTEKLTGLPTLPSVVTKITMLMQNPRTSASEVGQAITMDQSLTSKTLKLVNSAFYGFPGRINTITHAIVILGFTTVKNVVLTASIFNIFGKKTSIARDFNMEAFWLHSISTGAVAKLLADQQKSKFAEECFIGGLLHDLGKVVLCHCSPRDFMDIVEYARDNHCLFIEAEEALLNTNHQMLGSWVADKWNLPNELAAVLQYHHNPELSGSYQEITSNVHLADILSRALGSGTGGDSSIPIAVEAAWKKAKMGDINLPKLLQRAETEIAKASVFLQAM